MTVNAFFLKKINSTNNYLKIRLSFSDHRALYCILATKMLISRPFTMLNFRPSLMLIHNYQGCYPYAWKDGDNHSPWHRTSMGPYIDPSGWVHKNYPVLQCPSGMAEPVNPGYYIVSYAYNRGSGEGPGWLLNASGNYGKVKTTRTVKKSSTTILVAERLANIYGSTTIGGCSIDNINTIQLRHLLGSNYLFVDGHAKYLKRANVNNTWWSQNH